MAVDDTTLTQTPDTSNVTFQDLSTLMAASGQQPPAQQTQQDGQAQTQPDLSTSPVLMVHGTHYGYKGDPNSDPNSAVGRGAWDNQLQGGVSVGLSPDVEAALAARPNDQFVWNGKDGRKIPITFHDRTASNLRGRVDLYDPDNSIGDLGEGTISRVGATGPTKPMFQESDTATQSKPASYGMRVATQDDVARADAAVKNGFDLTTLPQEDQIALALGKDPNFFTRDENFDAYYNYVYKPLKAQSGFDTFNKFMQNLGPSFLQTIQNVGAGVGNAANTAKDTAELAFRKATGQTSGEDYQALVTRLGKEWATEASGTGQAISDTGNFLIGVTDGIFQAGGRPIAQLVMGHDPQSADQIDRVFAHALQRSVAGQQELANLGKQVQNTAAAGFKAVGGLGDLGKSIQNATPDERAASGIATIVNPLNFIGLGAGADAVGAIKPLFFEKGLQTAEETAGAIGKKTVLDASQILPDNPEFAAARPGYVETRNVQAGLAPEARAASQDVSDSTQALAAQLTSLNKIAGDPGAVTVAGAKLLQAAGATVDQAGQAASTLSKFPEWIANKLNIPPEVQDFAGDMIHKAVFGGLLHHFGAIGGVIEAGLEHISAIPKVTGAIKDLTSAMGQELMMGEATLPFWQRVQQRTGLMSKGMASFLDSPAMVTAQSMAAGGAEAAAVGGVLGGLQGAGSTPGGGLQGALGGAAQGGILGMAGGGLGQWMKFRDPNQYLLQARGDWQRYKSVLSPTELQNFGRLSPTNQLMLAQHAHQFPGLQVKYINDPTGPRGFHYTDEANRPVIQINQAAPDSVIRGTMAHELTHAATQSGMLPEIMDTLLGNPDRNQAGQYTALDADGNPLGTDPATGRYQTNQDFANLRNQYLNQMTESGLPTSHLTDADIAKEIYAEHGVDYMMSGGALLDANSAFRPGLFSRNAMKTALAKQGFTFDGDGKMIGAPGGTIGGTGLFQDLQRNPDLMKMAQTYFQKGAQEGAINSEEQSTRRFTRKDMQNPNTAETFLANDPQIMRDQNGKVIRNPLTGEPAYRTVKQVKDYNAKFADALKTGVEALSEDQRMELGYRNTGENSFFVRYLPDQVLDALAKTNEYNPNQIASLRMLSRVLADKGNPGMEMRLFYRKALTAAKKYGSFEGTEKLAVPYGFQVTGQNNVNIRSVDFNQLGLNFQRVMKREPYKSLWKNESEFDQDAHTYFVNHTKGDPGATGIGEAKRDAINALAGFDTQTHRESNPLVDKMPASVRPIIKDYSIDRANQISATGAKRPFISEDQYYAMNRNYLPGKAGPTEVPAEAAAAPAPDETAIPVTTRTTRTGKEIPQTIPYGITSAPLVADKQPPANLTDNNFGHVDFLTKPEQQKLTHLDKASAVTDYADKLVDEFGKWKDNKDVMVAKGWYRDVRKYLTKSFGGDREMFAHLLAATSAGQGVVQNWRDAIEAYKQYRSGAYDDMIREFKRTGEITDVPTKANGTKFGFNSDAVLKVLAGTWFNEVEGPKTPNFFKNLFGRGTDATIDMWAARTMRRLGYEGVEGAPAQWRLTPPSETGVSDLDFAFSQQAFKQAADRLGMKPHELQAVMWYAEKHLWAEKGWAKGGAQAAKASYVPMLKAYSEHVAAHGGPEAEGYLPRLQQYVESGQHR